MPLGNLRFVFQSVLESFASNEGEREEMVHFKLESCCLFFSLPIYCEKPNQWVAIFYLLAASSFSMSLFNLANAASLLSLHTLDKGIRCPDHQLSPSLVEILQGHCRTHACLQSSHLVVVYLFSYLYMVHMHCILYLHNVSVFPPRPYPSPSLVSTQWGSDPDPRRHCILSVNERV